MKQKFAEQGYVISLLRREGEAKDAALARFFENEQIAADYITHPLLRSMYLFIKEAAVNDVAVTPEMLAAEFDEPVERIYQTLNTHPADALPLYAAELSRYYAKRVGHEVAKAIQAAEGDPQKMLEAIAQLDKLGVATERRIYTLAEHATLFMKAFQQDQEDMRNFVVKPQFPLPRLNNLVPKIMPDDVILLTARSKTGKSSFSTQWAYTNARKGLRVAYFHFEDPPARVGYRRAAQIQAFMTPEEREALSGNPRGMRYKKMMSQMLSDREQRYVESLTARAITEAGDNLLYVYASGWTCEKMIAVWRQLHNQNPVDLIIIDYLNKMALSPSKLRNYGQWGARGQDVELIKQEAGRPNARVPVVLVQQENPDGTPRDSKDSYIKSQVWISLQREPSEIDPERFAEDGQAVVKRANDGQTGAVDTFFDAGYMIWSEQ